MILLKVNNSYNGGYGETPNFLSDPTEISFLTTEKQVDTYHEIYS